MTEGFVLKYIRFYAHALIVTASWPNPDGPEKPIEDSCPAVVRLFCIFFCIHSQLLALIYERSQSIIVL